MKPDEPIQAPLVRPDETAPGGVCGRWLGAELDGRPCGARATHHVIWGPDMRNGAVCDEHTREVRQRWVYIGLHPYTDACHTTEWWRADLDRCIPPGLGMRLLADAARGATT